MNSHPKPILYLSLILTIALSVYGHRSASARQRDHFIRYRVIDFGSLWKGESGALDLNDQGDMIGWYVLNPSVPQAADHPRSFFYHAGRLYRLARFNALKLNNHGEIAGSLKIEKPARQEIHHAAIWKDGKVIDLGILPGCVVSVALGINNREDAVGYSGPNWGERRLCLWHAGKIQRVLLPRATETSWLMGINDSGVAVGVFSTHQTSPRTFVYRNPRFWVVPAAGWVQTEANAINNKGEIVGALTSRRTGPDTLDFDNTSHAFLWSKGRMIDLGSLPGYDSEATAVNGHGVVVGRCWLANPPPSPNLAQKYWRAVVWERGQIKDLNHLIPPASGWILEQANGINNKNEIVGIGTIHGRRHAFVLTPLR